MPSAILSATLSFADTQTQLMMVAGFVTLGWVLARRQIRGSKRVADDARSARQALQTMRHRGDPAMPLSDAPPATQRWQVAMFDLQRELKAELDTRIAVVQSLTRQLDARIARLDELERRIDAARADAPSPQPPTAEGPIRKGV